MLPEPVKRYSPPKYPTQETVMKDPKILYITPKRWKGKPGVMTALVLTITTGLAACGSSGPDASSGAVVAPESSGFGTSSTVSEYVTIGEVPDASVPLTTPVGETPSLGSIPVFEHGLGRGSYGCVSVAPPVFLSEEEAMQVIREEAEAQGVNFDSQKTISGTFPGTDLSGTVSDPGTWEGDLKLDGYDAKLNIGVEFISTDDVSDWHQDHGVMSSVSSYEALQTAQALSDVTENVAIFYDPMSADFREFNFDWEDPEGDYDAYSVAYTAEQKEKVIEDLRAQVQDFLEWLKGQGVI